MLSSHNILSPAHGRPIVAPNQDIVIGEYYVTEIVDDAPGRGRAFALARRGDPRLRARSRPTDGQEQGLSPRADQGADAGGALPDDGSRVRRRRARRRDRARAHRPTATARCSSTRRSVACCSTRRFPATSRTSTASCEARRHRARRATWSSSYPKAAVAESLDQLKDLGFEYSTRSGLTISISDVRTPAEKAGSSSEFEARGREGRAAVRPRHHHRRRAAPEGDRDLDRGHRPGHARRCRWSSRPSSSTRST